jgi:hypothetical protein
MNKLDLFKRFSLAILLPLSMVLVALSNAEAKDPDPAAAQLTADISYLKTTLAKKGKTTVKPLKAVAMMVAMQAQDQAKGDDADKLAGTRDQALKVAEALAKGTPDWDLAIKASESLGTAKGDAKKVVKFEATDFDVQELMTVFRPKNKGGLGLETTLLEQVKGVKDAKVALGYGNQIVLIGKYSELLAKSMNAGNKEKDWIAHAKEMQKVGGDLVTEASKEKPDLKALTKAMKAIELNCTACHKDFRK